MTTTLDFNNLATGTVVDNEFQSQGVTVSAFGGSGQAMVFDTANPTGGDHDLATNNLGKALIISEDGDGNDPDDNASGGTFRFQFHDATSVESLTFLDNEEGATVYFYDEHGQVMGQQTIAGGVNNGQQVVSFDVEGAYWMDVCLHGSGAIDNLVFDQGAAGDNLDGIVEGTDSADVINNDYEGDPDGDKTDNGDAVLQGQGAQDDIIIAGGGNDFVLAGDGDDKVQGNDGDDTLCGQDGDDTLHGGAGNDFLEGMNDNDVVDGGTGNDQIFGDAGEDTLVGASGDDTIEGGSGADQISGGADDDKIEGGTGNDTIYGDDGGVGADAKVRESFEWDKAPDTNGGGGAGIDNGDELDSGFTQNTGNVDVTYFVTNATSAVTNAFSTSDQNSDGIEHDGDGVDENSSLDSILNGNNGRADYHLAFSNSVMDVSFNINDVDGDGVVRVFAFDAQGNAIEVNLTGGSNVTISGDTIDSNGGYLEDTAAEYATTVSIPGPVSKIVIKHTQDGVNNSGINITDVYFDAPVADTGPDGDDSIDAGDGDDVVFGEGGNDTLNGDAGNDLLNGGDGDDRIFGGAGNDTLEGGDGNDTLGGADYGNDLISGGAGDDMVEASFGDDTIDGGSGNDDLWASADNDLVTGGTGNDNIHGGHGRDELYGEEDNDTIYGGSDSDTIDGGSGNDSLFGDGNFKDDTGAGAADTISGGDGDDYIEGNEGDDVIYGDNGEDTSGTAPTREIFEWDEGPGFGNNANVSDFSQDTGNANITFNILSASGGVTNEYETDAQYTADLDAGVNDNASFNSILNGDANSATYGWTSDTPVENVEFRINDIDGDGRVVVRAYDEDGNAIEVVLSDAGSDLALSNADGVPGNDTASSIDGDYVDDNDPGHSVLVTIPGPVSRWEVLHEQDGNLNSGINFTDIAFDVPGTPDTNGEGGDDTIIGGEGADQMFGEGGDDTFIVSSSDDGNGDVIDGGNGPDQTTDNDVLDLRGAGVLTIDQQADANDDGATSGTVTFADGSTLTFEGIETILTDPQNGAPTANDDDITVDEDDSVTFDPTANDSDPDGDPITVDSFTQPENGTVTQNPDGTLTYTPDPDYNGPDSFTVTVTDPSGETSTSTVNVDVTPINDGPDAVNDSDTTDEDTPITVDLLANDTDPENDALTVTGATVPAEQGTLVDNGDGTVTFTPAENFNGEATISYSITDGNGGTDTAIHTITVTPVNDDPVAVDDAADTLEEQPVVVDLIGNDTDVDGDPLTIGEVSVPADQGTVVDNGDGTVTFTPAENFTGPATITYTVVDGQGGSDEGEAIVNVGNVVDAPDAVDDEDTTDEDTSITVNLLANDTDPEGQALTVTGASVPAEQGTLVDNGDGTVTFTPAPNFNGEATISYSITDTEGGTDSAIHTINVTPVNDDPVAVDDLETTDEDTPVIIDLIGNDTDVDGDPLTIGEVSVPADQGTVVDNGDGTVTFTPAPNFNGPATITYTVVDGQGGSDEGEAIVSVGAVNDGPVANDDEDTTDEDTPITVNLIANDTDDDGDALTVLTATVPADQGTLVDNGDGTVTFTPAENFNGEATISYEISDGNGGTDTAEHTITVTPVNDDPVAVDDVETTDEDVSVVVDLIGNDTDVDGDPLTLGDVSVPADQGTVVDNGDGTVTFTPAPDFNGEATITYTVEDGQGGSDEGEAVVTVGAVNDGPDAVNDSDTTDEDTPITVDLLANDTDPENDALTVTGATVPAEQGTLVDNGDGTVTFTPAENFNGEATISYSITDGNGGTDTAIHTITVTPVNDDPVAVDDAADTLEEQPVVVDLIGNDTDVDGDPLTIGEVSVPADQGTVVDNGDGTVTFTPAENFTGPATITYTVVDGQGGSDEGEAIVNVGNVVDAPDAVDDEDTTDEDTSITVNLLANDTDPEGQALTVTGASVPAEQGTLVDNGDGTVTFTPAPNFNGEATISYSITDTEGGTDSAIHTINVTPVNDDPVAVDDLETTDEDTPVIIDLIGNDTDVDGDPLTIGEVSVPADQGTVVDNGDGTVTFTPAPNFNGPATITYTVVDGQGGSDEGEAIVSVGAVNDGPVANDDEDTTDEDTPITVNLIANDTDDDGDALTVLTATVPADQGTLVDNGDGTVTFTPAENFNGEATISYEISDGNGGTDTAEHTITVTPVNDGPTAVDDEDTTPFETPVIVNLTGNDTDPDGDPLTITDVSVPPEQGTVVDNGDGTVTFTPADDFEGPATITYTISDGNGGTDEGEAVVTVEEQPLDGIVSGTDDGELIDEDYEGDPEGDMVDNGDNIFSGDPEDEDDDIIEAGGGNDTVVAGNGDDSVDGGTGDDEITGGAGSDTIEGGEGDDVIDAGDPDNTFQIDKGYPGLFGGEEGTPEAEDDRDFVDGGAGNDTISTGDDRDTIVGGTGDDVIDGGIDDDVITGDEGDDRIVGGEGSDSIEGGIGNDTIYAGNDPVLGLDNLNIEDDGSNPFGPDLRPDNGIDTVSGGEGDDVIFGADDADILMGDEGNDFIDGEIDDDTIDGGIGDDTLLGGQGRDDISGGIGNDSIDGGSGKDLIDGGDGDDTIDGGTGADVIDGGEGNDLIDGGLNADTINGGAGNDTIIGGNGADVIDGGDGDDQIDGGTGDDTLNGGAGNDSITGATGDDVIDGGTGNDTIDAGNGGDDDLSGGDDRDTFINVNAGDVVDGNEGGDDFDTLDLSGSAPGGGSLQVVFEDANPENGVVNYFDSDGNDAGQLTFTNIENVIPCFTPGTLIATPKGERRVEDLAVGDRIITRDNGIQEIRWMGAKDMKAADFAKAQHLRPIMISQGALGGGLPERDMMVSPNHRVLVANDKTALYFEEREVLVAAKFLTGLDGVDVVDVAWTTYIHIMFEQHEVVLSDGAWTESFQPGDQTLAGVGNAQRNEIFELFPELETREGIDGYTSARRTLKKHEAALLTK
ncbi:Bifunctional hemolysin/adenylate cyclase [Ascidiaceihabitans donghaensis]|uniref:Bifunctional hemolysin/adenylate cyclase n=1 Tax=Ascidiaceihabitans donghaensis TaxID=1510460 RepID=A0A2R8BDW2_9RHOB|nr:cadherin-like domain-containing protein [Ascidiaceihabitans donghaensis]SPH21255.1 Bifunctional hemolysin/adenylate cyclase [Ascidiaceihabitans donghaensis]